MHPSPGGRGVLGFLVTEMLLAFPETVFAFVSAGVLHEVWETLGGRVATLLHFTAQMPHRICPCLGHLPVRAGNSAHLSPRSGFPVSRVLLFS